MVQKLTLAEGIMVVKICDFFKKLAKIKKMYLSVGSQLFWPGISYTFWCIDINGNDLRKVRERREK